MKATQYKKLQRFFTILLIVLVSMAKPQAQSVANISYFMDNSPYKHQLNPALIPVRGYFSYPVLGSTYIDLQSNLGLTSFLFPDPAGGPLLTFMHPDVSAQEFLSQLRNTNYIGVNNRLSLLGAGFYIGRSFWNFELATRINTNLNIPKPFFEFLKNGMAVEEGSVYDIQNFDVSARILGEASLGASFPVIDNLRVGVKGKYLYGGGRARMGIDKLLIDMRQNQWSIETDAVLDIHLAGLDLPPNNEGYLDFESFDYDPSGFQAAGMGWAFDIGATYEFYFSRLLSVNVSAGLLDIGMVNWKKDQNLLARSHGKVVFTGLEGISFGGSDENNENDEDEDNFFEQMSEQFLEVIQLKPVSDQNNYIEKLAPTLNIGAEAGLLNNKISVGLLFSNRFIANNNLASLTTSLNFNPIPLISFSTAYTLLNGSFALGAGVGLNLYVANIFLACDYIPLRVNPQFIPLTKANTNLQLGLSIPLAKMRKGLNKPKKNIFKKEEESNKEEKLSAAKVGKADFVATARQQVIMPDSVEMDTLQIDDLQIDSLQFDSLQFDSLIMDSLQMDSLQMEILPMDSLNVDSISNMLPSEEIQEEELLPPAEGIEGVEGTETLELMEEIESLAEPEAVEATEEQAIMEEEQDEREEPEPEMDQTPPITP